MNGKKVLGDDDGEELFDDDKFDDGGVEKRIPLFLNTHHEIIHRDSKFSFTTVTSLRETP